MNTPPPPPAAALEVQGLIDAIARNNGDESLGLVLSPSQWETLSNYMQPLSMTSGQVLFRQGAADRTLYFVQSGTLNVRFDEPAESGRMATVGAGSVVGEGGFFSHLPRSATVEVGTACTLWSLSPTRFKELAHRKPDIALEVSLAAGAVVARRMMIGKHLAAVT